MKSLLIIGTVALAIIVSFAFINIESTPSNKDNGNGDYKVEATRHPAGGIVLEEVNF